MKFAGLKIPVPNSTRRCPGSFRWTIAKVAKTIENIGRKRKKVRSKMWEADIVSCGHKPILLLLPVVVSDLYARHHDCVTEDYPDPVLLGHLWSFAVCRLCTVAPAPVAGGRDYSGLGWRTLLGSYPDDFSHFSWK
jgi:hypothetical protein